MASINQLKDSISSEARNGLAFANRYKVMFGLPEAIANAFPAASSVEFLDLMCDATGLPGRQIATLDYQAHKQSIKIPYGFLNEDVTFTFLLTNDFYVKKVFDAWTRSTIDFVNYRANYLEKHVSEVRVYQMAKGADQDKIVYGVKLMNAFPVTVGGLSLENSLENTVQKLSVVMTYENFEVIT